MKLKFKKISNNFLSENDGLSKFSNIFTGFSKNRPNKGYYGI